MRDAAAVVAGVLLDGSETALAALEPGAPARETVLCQPRWGFWAAIDSFLLAEDGAWRSAPKGAVCGRFRFGVLDDDGRPRTDTGPACEMTWLPKRFKRNREAVFLRDADGALHLGHRGLLRAAGADRKQPREQHLAPGAVLREADFPRVGPFGGARHPVIVIGAVSADGFIERLAHFVHDMAHLAHGLPDGAARLDALRKSRNWTDKAFSFFRRG